MLSSVLGFLWMSKMFFFSWIMLELLTWSMFYFFSLNWSKISQQNLYTFFLLQSATSILWLSAQSILEMSSSLKSSSEGNFFIQSILCLLTLILIFMKMGLFPGHVWSWQIYLTGQIGPILLMSTIQKIFPLMIIFIIIITQEFSSSLMLWLLLGSWLIVLLNLSGSFSFFSFIFLSGLLHYSIILLLGSFLNMSTASVYLLSYYSIFILIFFLLESKKFFSFNPEDWFEDKSILSLLLWSLIIGGFPPSLIFFLKLLFLMKLEESLFSGFIFVLLLTFFVYLLIIFFSIFRKMFSPLFELIFYSGFLFFIQDFYFLFSIFIFYSGFLFFMI